MRTPSAAALFEQAGRLFAKLPDRDVLSALRYLEQLVDADQAPSAESTKGTETAASTKSISRSQQPDSPHISTLPLSAKLAGTTLEELEAFIRTSPSLRTKNQLGTLATELGLPVTTRHTKEKLIQAILTHYEMQYTHTLMRTSQT
ncbi:hypothetical protein EV586_1216 [Tumebacillus sp. BK434]|uniref:hypothetical protein n=1 Tax=Tumebacillus sp. BK434 TaxID=2512169 RepID=UPI00104E856C|nr:hypothetical protein [Tumebacillus sp. BK434]TCP50998.1 hypothetical protein EV586_1216 [Tumebacillus sp. BK434]